jgi:fructose-bisphosphate aldolase class II
VALISLRQLLDHAAEHGYGVPAFNVNNLEQMRAIMEAADETNSPVIVQASAGARKYAGAPVLRRLVVGAVAGWPAVPVGGRARRGPDLRRRVVRGTSLGCVACGRRART